MSRGRSERHTDAREDAFIPAALRCNVGFLLARAGGESRRRFVHSLAAWELRPSHYGVLLILDELDTASQQRLGQIVGVDPRNMVGIIDLLEERGLVAREPDPRDRRRHAVRLTESGRTTFGELRRANEAVEREMLSALSDTERSTLRGLLARLFGTESDKDD